MIDEYSDFFPSVHIDDFSPFIKKRVEQYTKIASHCFYINELENLPKEYRRTKKIIEEHCRSGIRKEVAFALIHGLNPIVSVDFQICGSADRYDIALGKYGKCYIDATTADILEFKKNNKNEFEIGISLSKEKYQSILERSRTDWYIANEIAFLKQKNRRIYYIGRIKVKDLLNKEFSEEQKNKKIIYCFIMKGNQKELRLKKEILLI